MTPKGPYQPKAFYDSMKIVKIEVSEELQYQFYFLVSILAVPM